MAIKMKEKDEEISKLAEELFADVDKKKEKEKIEEKEERRKNNKEEIKESLQKEEKITTYRPRHKIKIKAGPELIKKSITYGILFILIIFFFWNPFYLYFPWNHGTVLELAQNYIEQEGYVLADDIVTITNTTINSSSDNSDNNVNEETNIEINSTENDSTNSSNNNSTNNSDNTSSTTSVENGIIDNEGIKFEVISVQTEIVSQDNVSYGKIKSITFSIDAISANQIKPRIKAYIWDDNRKDTKNTAEINKRYGVLTDGEFSTYTEQIGGTGSFDNYNTVKYIRIELFDIRNNNTKAYDYKLGETTIEVNIE